MKTFKTQLRSKINEFLFDRLAKMDTQSKEFWAEANSSNRISKRKPRRYRRGIRWGPN